MASDPIVPHPVIGPSRGEDTDDDSLVLGPVISGNKYCEIHTVVASSWQTEPAEAHVFNPTNKAQARFLNRSVWPKLRKSLGFKQEIKKDDGRTIFIISDKGPTLVEEVEKPDSKPTKPDIAATAEAISPVEPAASTPSAPRDLVPIGFKPSAVGRSIFLRNYAYYNGKGAVPMFQSDGFPDTGQRKTVDEVEQLWYRESRDWFKRGELLPRDEKIPTEHKGANGTVLDSREEQNDGNLKRRRLAAEIAKESLECDTDGVCQFGYRFMIEHLYPWQKQSLASQALAEQTNRQRAWSNRLGEVRHHLPGILKTQEAKAEKAWLESLVYLDNMPEDHQTEHQAAQNTVVMRWFFERSFSGFGPKAAAMLSDSFDCDGCDGEPIMKWMLRIRSHVRMRKWAIEELSKAPDTSDRANPVLMRLIEAHTAHELVLGMKPLIDRMNLVSQFELGYWEGVVAFLHGKDMDELENISGRWKARRSILKPKKTE